MEPKPGRLTTEFWSTLVSAVMMVLVGIGLVAVNDAANLERAVTNAIAAVMLFLTQAAIVSTYIKGRQRLKEQPPPADGPRTLKLHDHRA